MKPLAARFARSVLPPLALFVTLVVAWQVATAAFDVPAYLVPGPDRVVRSAVEHAGDLAGGLWLTGGAALCGFALSVILGTALGLLFSQSTMIERSMYPYAIFLQTVPIVAIAPILIMWFGNGFGGVVAVSFILSLFPVVTNATAGLTLVDPNLLELFTIHNATRWQVLTKLRLPNSVPLLVTGAKISCGLSVIGAIVGELFAGFGTGGVGLGTLLSMANGRLDTPYVFAAMFTSTLLSVVIFGSVSLIGSTILARWHIAAAPGSTAER